MHDFRSTSRCTRRHAIRVAAASAAMLCGARTESREPTAGSNRDAAGTSILDFEKKLAEMRLELYRHPPIDILKKGFRPIGGRLADFCTIGHQGRHHFFYIERRLTEGTPFYPGHEIYFGHASTADFFHWEVHDPVMLVRPGTWEGAHVWAPFMTYLEALRGVAMEVRKFPKNPFQQGG